VDLFELVEMENFINTGEFSRYELEAIVKRASANKGSRSSALAGKSVALLFFNSSLRTRSSFEVAVAQLGGHSTTLEVGNGVWAMEFGENVVMDGSTTEHIKDAARVLSRYFDAICVRSFPRLQNLADDEADPVLEAMRTYASVPVINLESCLYHPCQSMADMMTIRERFGRTDGVKVALSWAWHPKALPTAVGNSFAIAARQFGCDLTIVAPREYPLPEKVMQQLGDVRVTDDRSVLAEQDAVYVKSWTSLLDYGTPPPKELRHWIADSASLGSAAFMHCMPLRRNVEVTDEVLESSRNMIYDIAENRLHVQKEILLEVLG
jgi:N-acetylornithine carbamoyltransferase